MDKKHGNENKDIKATEEAEKAPAESSVKKRVSGSDAYDWLEVFVISAVIVLCIFTFLGRVVTVDGNSMLNTLHNGERLIISDLFYEPETGDIIVFQQKRSTFKEPLVKRVIATGGQTVEINFADWEVRVDGVLLDEPYVNRVLGSMNRYSMTENVITVDEGYIFVMGDNRNGSADSRYGGVGLVSENEVLGHVVFRIFPKTGTVK